MSVIYGLDLKSKLTTVKRGSVDGKDGRVCVGSRGPTVEVCKLDACPYLYDPLAP